MFLNMDQLEKQLDKEEFQEIGSMADFKVLETQFQMFIKSQIYSDDEYVVMTRNYFLQYTQLEIRGFRDTLIQHMEYVKKSINKKALHKREYDSRVNERQMQTTKEKVDTSKALDASLVNTESSWTESRKHDTSSSSGNDVDADDADIKPVYDEEPMAEVQLTVEINVLATRQQHTEQPEFNNEGEVYQNAEQCHDTWKPVLQSLRNQSVVRQPTAFKSERPRISKPRFASQVDVNNNLSKPVTTHYFLRERESALAKPHHMIEPSSSRYSSNDMVHNHYLKEANKKHKKAVPTGKIFTSSTTKVNSEPINCSNEDITNQYKCEQTLHVRAGTLNLSAAMTSDHNSSELRIHDHSNELSGSKLVLKVVSPADKTTTSRQELELLFHHHITMLSEAIYGLPTSRIDNNESSDDSEEEPYLFKVCSDGMIRRCVSGPETRTILDQCPHGPTGGPYGPNVTAKKVLDSGFYWPTIIKEAHTIVRLYEACQKMGNISKCDEMPLNNIKVCEIFNIWGIDFMGPFSKSHKFEYILVVVDYVSKWAEAQSFPTNDARVVITFLKKLFCRFGMPKALISDRGTHFCNKIMEKTMKRYGVNHRFSTSYHPQTSGQVENTNRALKRILEKTVKDNLAVWSRKLDDALWAFHTAYKTPNGTTPYKLKYGKNCHLPFEIEHRAYWALKNCNPDLIDADEKRMFQLHELDELRHQAYENSRLYKARTKVWHDRKLRMRK
ncbi:reverse transcriptase domain-containing protein [Tanacetum coccineum]|uniref:Reverse transcriptase domain-containing protein n=1 Tax=Tanacetum coccineum TaxID=301880 RepID=A0ABQ5FHQ0_9ASTR